MEVISHYYAVIIVNIIIIIFVIKPATKRADSTEHRRLKTLPSVRKLHALQVSSDKWPTSQSAETSESEGYDHYSRIKAQQGRCY